MISTSNESSGVRTWIVSSVLFQDACTFCSAASAPLDRPVTRDQPLDVLGVRALTEQEHDAAALSRLQDDLHLQRRARIQPGAELRLERQVAQRGRPGQRTVAADERETVAGRRTRHLAGMRERDALRRTRRCRHFARGSSRSSSSYVVAMCPA